MKQITSVLGVEQNENISMLTWVTIAYLPLTFVTVSSETCFPVIDVRHLLTISPRNRDFSLWAMKLYLKAQSGLSLDGLW